MGYTFEVFQRYVYMLISLFMFVPTVIMVFLVVTGKFNIVVGFGVWFFLLSAIFYLLISLPSIQSNVIGFKVDKDMPMMTRRFVINLQSGMSLFSAYADLANSKTFSARFFDEVVSKIYLGLPIEKAIQDSVRLSPSRSFRKVQTQVKSALLTGSDLEKVMEVTLSEMIKEQITKINQYGKKLGPLAMIYLIFGVVMPSIGSVGIVLILSVGLGNIAPSFFTLLFWVLTFLLLLIQFVFINLFASMRPNLRI